MSIVTESRSSAVQLSLLWPNTTFKVVDVTDIIQVSPSGLRHTIEGTNLEQIANFLRQGGYRFVYEDNGDTIKVTQLPPR